MYRCKSLDLDLRIPEPTGGSHDVYENTRGQNFAFIDMFGEDELVSSERGKGTANGIMVDAVPNNERKGKINVVMP